MDYLGTIASKILFIVLLMGIGAFVKKAGMVSDAGERDLSLLMVDLAWPAFIVHSINTSLTASDIVGNLSLPFLSAALHLAGFAIGAGLCAAAGFSGDRKNVFLFHATMNNFFIVALPFAQFLLPQKGMALLTVSNLGSTVVLWTLGVSLLSGKLDRAAALRSVFSPAMVATLCSTVLVLTGLNRFVPSVVLDVAAAAGQTTLFLGLLVAGTQIGRLGSKAIKFDSWNLLTGLVRNILVPALAFGFCLAFRDSLPREAVVITMLVSIAPASVNSIPLAMRYGSSPTLAAEGVLFTHLLAVPTMVGFIYLIDRFFLA